MGMRPPWGGAGSSLPLLPLLSPFRTDFCTVTFLASSQILTLSVLSYSFCHLLLHVFFKIQKPSPSHLKCYKHSPSGLSISQPFSFQVTIFILCILLLSFQIGFAVALKYVHYRQNKMDQQSLENDIEARMPKYVCHTVFHLTKFRFDRLLQATNTKREIYSVQYLQFPLLKSILTDQEKHQFCM